MVFVFKGNEKSVYVNFDCCMTTPTASTRFAFVREIVKETLFLIVLTILVSIAELT